MKVKIKNVILETDEFTHIRKSDNMLKFYKKNDEYSSVYVNENEIDIVFNNLSEVMGCVDVCEENEINEIDLD